MFFQLNVGSNKQMFMSFCLFVVYVFFIVQFLFLPIITCYLLALLAFIKVPKVLQACLLIYIVMVFSFLVTSQPDWQAIESDGFGSDIFFYKNAFKQLIDMQFFDLTKVLTIAVSNTGSAEPLFWSFAYFLSRIVSSPNQLWFAITFFALSALCFYSSKGMKYSPISILVVFCSTITFYAYQGSVLRQGLALVFVYIGLSELGKNKAKNAFVILGMASFVHFSAFILLIAAFLGTRVKEFKIQNIGPWLGYIAGVLALSMFFFVVVPHLPGDINLIYKIQTRISTAETYSSNWKVQFFLEIALFIFITKAFRIKLPEAVYSSFIIFSVIVILSIPLAGLADRLYRYSYAFYLFFYWYWFNSTVHVSNKYLMHCFTITIFFLWFCFLLSTRYENFFMETDIFGVLTARIDQLAVSWQ
jgi:hypothetical protein